MDILNRFNINEVVSFQLLTGADAIYQDGFKRCKAVCKLGYAQVSQLTGESPEVLHQRVYPMLPPGTCPSDPKKYNWLIIETQTGSSVAIGEPWINVDTIKKDDKKGWTFYCSNGPENGGQIGRDALLAAGFTVNSAEPD